MENQQLDSTNEISLIDLFKILRANLIMIVAFTLAIGLIAALYAFLVATPKYKSNAYVLVAVQVSGSQGDSFDLINAQRLLTTAGDLISMPVVLEQVIVALDLDLTPAQLKNNLTVTSSTTSFFINVSYLSEDPELAKDVVNEVINQAIIFANANIPILDDNIVRTSYANNGIYDSPNKVLYVVIGLILGGIVGVGFAFLKEMLNNTFRSKEQLEAAFGIQVLGVIPEFDVKEKV
jgi:capsular polysaccharide biosynthesis protein